MWLPCTLKGNLMTYKQYVHEVKKELWNACDFFASQKVILRKHKQSVHEKKKYPCIAFNCFKSQKVIIRTRKQSVHKGKKYPCDISYFLATQKGILRRCNDLCIKLRNIHLMHVISLHHKKES